MTAPGPPPDLASRHPELITLPTGAVLHRFYTRVTASGINGPIHFDRSADGRLNAPDAAYGVLYAAEKAEGAFAETFLREPGRALLPLDLVRRKAYVTLITSRPLSLVKLAGAGLAKVGATAEVTHGGGRYDVPQAWSAALRSHPVRPDGIAYFARHDDEQLCFALFDHSVPVEKRRIETLDQEWFWAMADRYGVGLAPS